MSVDIECPRCKSKFTERVLIAGEIVACPHCGFEIAIRDRDVALAEESRRHVRKSR